MKQTPMISVGGAARKLNMSQPTIQKALDNLVKLGIVKEVTGKRRNRMYLYHRYLHILSEGTEPLPP